MSLPLFIRSHHSRRRIPSIKQARYTRRFRSVLPTLANPLLVLPMMCTDDPDNTCGIDDGGGHEGGGGNGNGNGNGDGNGGIGLDEATCNAMEEECFRFCQNSPPPFSFDCYAGCIWIYYACLLIPQ